MTDLEALKKRIEELEKNQALILQQFTQNCFQCNGEGEVAFPSGVTQTCLPCNGTGKVIMLKSGTGI